MKTKESKKLAVDDYMIIAALLLSWGTAISCFIKELIDNLLPQTPKSVNIRYQLTSNGLKNGSTSLPISATRIANGETPPNWIPCAEQPAYARRKPEILKSSGHVTGVYPGSVLHFKVCLENIGRDDFHIDYRSKNQFQFLSNSESMRDQHGAGDLVWYIEDMKVSKPPL
ncbi:hypothetical protein N7465_009212 [Penicillium sp. CMV-2018d]|nr:hypothetical protein N7465_009212 [Penicillium sp. CMV-2018d]